MNKKLVMKAGAELNSVVSKILSENLESNFIERKIKNRTESIFSDTLQKYYKLRLKESRNLSIQFDEELAINSSLLPAINKLIYSVKENLILEGIQDRLINKIIRVLDTQLKGNMKLKIRRILNGEDIVSKTLEENYSKKYIQSDRDYLSEDLVQRVQSNRNSRVKKFFNTQEGKLFLKNLSGLNDLELVDKLFSNESKLIESMININFSIDSEDTTAINLLSRSLGLLKMICINPRVINSIEKKPKLLKLFKDKDYDSVVSNSAKDLSDIFVALPGRISKSKQGQINVSNDDYSRLNDKTKRFIDDYRTIMSDYYPENLIDVFESKVYSGISELFKEDDLDESLRVKLIEHFSNYYLDVFNKRRKQNIYESKMNVGLGRYFISNSSSINAHKYALKELNRYILSEGLMDKIKRSLFGGNVSSGVAGKLNNWFKNTSVMKFMKKVSNAMNDDIEEWENKLNPNQKKMFNDYPHLKAIFATGGLNTNLATHLIQNRTMLQLLNKFPNLAVIIAKNPKVADLLLKRDKRLLPKLMENPEIFDWLEDNEKLAGKILNGNSSHLQVLQACILNFNLATKIANDEKIISEVGLDNLVDLAELMNTSSDLADLLDSLDPKEFKELAKILFDKPKVLDFLQSDSKGKELVKLAKNDSNDIIVKAIIDNPDKFTGDSDITKIEGNENYNKILAKHISKFKDNSNKKQSEEDGQSGESNERESNNHPNTPESQYTSIWNGLGSDRRDKAKDFRHKFRVEECSFANLEDLEQDSSVTPRLTDEVSKDDVFWMYKDGSNYKVVINAKKIVKIKFNSKFGYKYIFDLKGSKSEGTSVVSIEPAIFKKDGEEFELVKEGKIELENN